MAMEMGNLPPFLDPETDHEDDEQGTTVPLDADQVDASDYTTNPDGSVDIQLGGDDETSDEPGEFDENLAENMTPEAVKRLGSMLSDLIEQDIRGREGRDKQYSEGIKRTGAGEKAPGGAEFDGASTVSHPMLMKGCIDFASRAIKELFPANGPCKTEIIGEQTEAKLDQAERKKKFMNWQMTKQIVEQRDELEKLLSQVPLAGVQYKRWWWDHALNRPRTETFYVDDVFLAIGSAGFYTSPRTTFRQKITAQVFEQRVDSGLYRELPSLGSAVSINDRSRSETASNKVEGVDPDEGYYSDDGIRVVYQVEVQLSIEEDTLVEDDRVAPYIVHLDDSTDEVLGIYRNWDENDENYRKKEWATEWPFIPWRGGQAIGLTHIIGTLAGTATGAVRAIMDAGHIANFPGGLMLDGGKTPGESKQVSATQLVKIAAPVSATDPDIRKLVMSFPFPGPSQVLFNMLEWLTQYAEGVIQTASDKIADGGNDMPVGTAMALIEHGAANFSAIHARLHYAMGRDLQILHRLNGENLDDEEVVAELGELMVRREDFQGPMDIVPVSDPNIFSETQRYAQIQAVLQLQGMPAFQQFFKADQLLRRALKLLQITDPESLANLPGEPKKLGPIDENYAISSAEDGAPLKVYQEQDDIAHLKAHIHYATSPMFGANPLIAPKIMPGMLQHCKEHLLALYKKHTVAAAQAVKVAFQMRNIQASEEDVQLQAAAFADQMLNQLLGPMVMPGLQQMQQIVTQIMQSQAPKPSPDIQLAQDTFKEIEMAKIAAGKEKDTNKAANDEADRKNEQVLAQLATNVQGILQQQKEASDQMRAEFLAQHETQQTVLTSVLTAALQDVTTSGVGPDGKPTQAKSSSGIAELLLKPLMAQVQQALGLSIEEANGQTSPLVLMMQNLMAQQQNLAGVLQAQQQTNAQTFQQLGAEVQGLSQRLAPPQAPPGGPQGGQSAQPGQPQGQPAPPGQTPAQPGGQ